jgi:hypothetical protein
MEVCSGIFGVVFLICIFGILVFIALMCFGQSAKVTKARKEAREEHDKKLARDWQETLDRVTGIKDAGLKTDRQNDN